MLALLFSYSRYACFVPVATACLAGGEPYNRSASQGARGTGVHPPACEAAQACEAAPAGRMLA